MVLAQVLGTVVSTRKARGLLGLQPGPPRAVARAVQPTGHSVGGGRNGPAGVRGMGGRRALRGVSGTVS